MRRNRLIVDLLAFIVELFDDAHEGRPAAALKDVGANGGFPIVVPGRHVGAGGAEVRLAIVIRVKEVLLAKLVHVEGAGRLLARLSD